MVLNYLVKLFFFIVKEFHFNRHCIYIFLYAFRQVVSLQQSGSILLCSQNHLVASSQGFVSFRNLFNVAIGEVVVVGKLHEGCPCTA